MPEPVVSQNPNYLGAFFSFLRVLATNAATALTPLFLVDMNEYPAGKALVVAFAVSLLLTVTNFFRSGETRFGTPPNVVDAAA